MSMMLCWRILFFSRQLFLFFAVISLGFYYSCQCSVDPFLIIHFVNDIGPSYLLLDQQCLWYPPHSFRMYMLKGRPASTQEVKRTGIREGNHLLSLTPHAPLQSTAGFGGDCGLRSSGIPLLFHSWWALRFDQVGYGCQHQKSIRWYFTGILL